MNFPFLRKKPSIFSERSKELRLEIRDEIAVQLARDMAASDDLVLTQDEIDQLANSLNRQALYLEINEPTQVPNMVMGTVQAFLNSLGRRLPPPPPRMARRDRLA